MRFAVWAMFIVLSGCSRDDDQALLVGLNDADPAVRQSAARALVQLGSEAAFAMPALCDKTSDSNKEVRRLCCVALGGIGPAAVGALPELTQSLKDRELSVRLSAAFALQKIDPAGEAFVPELCAAMRMGEGGVIVAVGRMSPSPTWAVPTLVELLNDRRPGIRRLSVETLARIPPATQDIKAHLERAQQDPDDRVRDAAKTALSNYQPNE